MKIMKKINSYKNNIRIEGERIYLRPMALSDAQRHYVTWLNDREVNQYLESRFEKHTLVSLRKYIKKVLVDHDSIFLAIVRKDKNQHIGNIKVGPIDWHHLRGDIGIMIGDKKSWGRGFATEAIKLVSRYCFNELKLHKLTAGAYDANAGSIKAFLKAGFIKEAKLPEHFISDGEYVGGILLGLINKRIES